MDPEAIIWHDAECGGYADDLPVWEALAQRADGDILDVGSGTGRVTLGLAARGHRLWAVDRDPLLVTELARRALRDGLPVEARTQDCRNLDLGHLFALAVAPMQLVQLLGGHVGRLAFMSAVRKHLAPGGRLAMAIVEDVPPGLLADDGDPLPDVREVAGMVYSSTPVAAGLANGSLEVRRLRQVVGPGGELREETHVDRLDLLDAATVETEAEVCGLDPRDRLEVPAGTHHVGSTIVVAQRSA